MGTIFSQFCDFYIAIVNQSIGSINSIILWYQDYPLLLSRNYIAGRNYSSLTLKIAKIGTRINSHTKVPKSILCNVHTNIAESIL